MSSSWEEFEELIKQEMRRIYSEAAIEHGIMKGSQCGIIARCQTNFEITQS